MRVRVWCGDDSRRVTPIRHPSADGAGSPEERLADLKRPWGDREQHVGKKAEKNLMYAEVLATGKKRVVAPAAISFHDNYVMFDLEGMPPYRFSAMLKLAISVGASSKNTLNNGVPNSSRRTSPRS